MCSASTTISPAAKITSRELLCRPAFRSDAARHHPSAFCRGRRNLQSRLPRLADSLPIRPGTDDKDQRHRRDQYAGAGKAAKGKDISGFDIRGLWRPDSHPQPESYRGNVNPIGPRACYDEGKRCAETLFFDYYRQHNLKIRVARIFNTYGPRMHPNDGRVVSNFIVQALRERTDHALWRRHADPRLLLCRRSDRAASSR